MNHNHGTRRVPALDDDGQPIVDEHGDTVMRTIKGRDACPVCSLHDHSNKEPFGFDIDGQDLPGWWFDCPICGTSDSQVHVHRWSKAGIEWIRHNPHHIGPAAADGMRAAGFAVPTELEAS